MQFFCKGNTFHFENYHAVQAILLHPSVAVTNTTWLYYGRHQRFSLSPHACRDISSLSDTVVSVLFWRLSYTFWLINLQWPHNDVCNLKVEERRRRRRKERKKKLKNRTWLTERRRNELRRRLNLTGRRREGCCGRSRSVQGIFKSLNYPGRKTTFNSHHEHGPRNQGDISFPKAEEISGEWNETIRDGTAGIREGKVPERDSQLFDVPSPYAWALSCFASVEWVQRCCTELFRAFSPD